MKDKELPSGKHLHLLVALAAVIATSGLLWALPDLHHDAPTTLGTLTGMATLYGVVIALVEVSRTKSYARIAAESAREAAERVHNAYGLRDRSECQSSIEFALQSIEDTGQIAGSLLARIARLYSAEFPGLVQDDQSDVRAHIAIIESYAALPRSGAPSRTKRIKETLISMTVKLAALSAQRIRSEEGP